MKKYEGRKPVAFVLGLGVNGYGIVRSLAKEEVPIVGIHSSKENFGRYSKYCRASYQNINLQDEDKVCQILLEQCGKLNEQPVLFPTDDHYAAFLARRQEILSAHFLFHWVPLDTLNSIVDKMSISQLCEQSNILIPRTYMTHPEEDLAEASNTFLFPCLIKPVRSFNTNFPPSIKNFVAENPEDLIRFYEENPGLKGTTLWQEIVEGGDEDIFQCTGLVGKNGHVGPLFSARKFHQYPPNYGIMCLGKSESNASVRSESQKVLRSLGYRGLASLEFKYNQKNGQYYFIEMNPRLPWYNGLFVDAGVNLPFMAYLDLIEEFSISSPNKEQEDGIYWMSLQEELGWFWRTRRNGKTDMFQWLRTVGRVRSFAWWNWRDPMPFCLSTVNFFKQLACKFFEFLFRFSQPAGKSPLKEIL